MKLLLYEKKGIGAHGKKMNVKTFFLKIMYSMF